MERGGKAKKEGSVGERRDIHFQNRSPQLPMELAKDGIKNTVKQS